MLIRFFQVDTNTTDGVYRKSDFINNEYNRFWLKEDAKCPATLVAQGEYNFDASDMVSELTVLIKDIPLHGRVTHIVAETGTQTYNRVVSYVVDYVEYLGNKQVTYHLSEDVFLSHLSIVLNNRVLVSRTNDTSKFLSNDVADLAYSRERNPIDIDIYDYTGKWVVYTLAINADEYSYFYVKYRNLNPANYEYFADLNAIKAKYPEVSTLTPNAVSYFGKIVNQDGALRQAQYNFGNKKIEWLIVPLTKTGYTEGSSFDFQKNQLRSGWVGPSVKLITGDMLTLNIAFPVADNIHAYGITSYVSNTPVYSYRNLPSADRIESMKIDSSPIDSFIISKRIVTGLVFNEQGTHRPTGAGSTTIYMKNPNVDAIGNWLGVDGDVPVCLPIIKSMNSVYNFTFDLTDPLEYEPFNNYYLNVFGQSIPVKGKLHNTTITIKSALSSANWSVTVFADNLNNILWSGRISAEMPYALDKYQDFIAQNSSYTTSKWVNTILGGGTRTITGGLSGLLAGGVGGAIAGGASGLVSVGQDIANYGLQEKAMKDAPDTIKGDGNDFGTIDINTFGIYFYSMEVTSDVLPLMETEYYAKGFPTSFITTIDGLALEDNDIYGKCKFVSGRMVDMVYNYSITARISDRIRAGVFMLENKYRLSKPEITDVVKVGSTFTWRIYNRDTEWVKLHAYINFVLIKAEEAIEPGTYIDVTYTPSIAGTYNLRAKATAVGHEDSPFDVVQVTL